VGGSFWDGALEDGVELREAGDKSGAGPDVLDAADVVAETEEDESFGAAAVDATCLAAELFIWASSA
jgi:hypothetical protein